MKAEDLMIGDWVYFKDKIIDQAVRVECIMANDHPARIRFTPPWDPDDEIDAPINCFYPIPITEEILCKNGLTQWTGGGTSTKMLCTPFGELGPRWSVYVGLRDKDIDMHCAPGPLDHPGWRKSNKVTLNVCDHYVHVLQHALRLCGIDLEIKLQ